MERLKEALRRLRDAAKRGNQPDAAAAVKDINDAVGKQVALARAAAARTKVLTVPFCLFIQKSTYTHLCIAIICYLSCARMTLSATNVM